MFHLQKFTGCFLDSKVSTTSLKDKTKVFYKVLHATDLSFFCVLIVSFTCHSNDRGFKYTIFGIQKANVTDTIKSETKKKKMLNLKQDQ